MAKSKKGHKALTQEIPQPIPVDQIIHQCLVSFGSGTGGLPTKLDAINDLVLFLRGRILNALKEDPLRWTVDTPEHEVEKAFILRCAAAIGRLAAQIATKNGMIHIDRTHTTAARDIVIKAAKRITKRIPLPPTPYCHLPRRVPRRDGR